MAAPKSAASACGPHRRWPAKLLSPLLQCQLPLRVRLGIARDEHNGSASPRAADARGDVGRGLRRATTRPVRPPSNCTLLPRSMKSPSVIGFDDNLGPQAPSPKLRARRASDLFMPHVLHMLTVARAKGRIRTAPRRSGALLLPPL
jgi:hypothetical protein